MTDNELISLTDPAILGNRFVRLRPGHRGSIQRHGLQKADPNDQVQQGRPVPMHGN